MSYITRNLRETITHWAAGGPDGFGGHSWTRQTLKARWEQRAELMRDREGNQTVSDAVVYVDRDVSVGDYLFRGSSTVSDPTSLHNAYQVRDFRKVPNIKGTIHERKAML